MFCQGGMAVARRIYFSVRPNRRFRANSKGRGKVWLYALAAVMLLMGGRYIFRQIEPASTFAATTQQESSPLLGLAESIYLRIVSNVIPGFNDHDRTLTEGEASNAEDHYLQKLALNDLRDPKKMIYAQIPYLGVVPETLINKPATEQVDQPKITFPVRGKLTGEGTVLLYHTHATESFVPSSGKAFVSTDLSQTITQLGAELASLLQNEYQISVYHDQTIHDVPRTGAYERALPTITELLKTYPNTALVVDLHRDGVAKKITTTTLNGQAAARILLVVGSRHADWQENMTKAEFMHKTLEKLAPGISRGIRERPLVYNQNVHPGSLLIELGGYQNSLEEVRRTLPVLAEALALLYRAGQ